MWIRASLLTGFFYVRWFVGLCGGLLVCGVVCWFVGWFLRCLAGEEVGGEVLEGVELRFGVVLA